MTTTENEGFYFLSYLLIYMWYFDDSQENSMLSIIKICSQFSYPSYTQPGKQYLITLPVWCQTINTTIKFQSKKYSWNEYVVPPLFQSRKMKCSQIPNCYHICSTCNKYIMAYRHFLHSSTCLAFTSMFPTQTKTQLPHQSCCQYIHINHVWSPLQSQTVMPIPLHLTFI